MSDSEWWLEHLWPYPRGIHVMAGFNAPMALHLIGPRPLPNWEDDVRSVSGLPLTDDDSAWPIECRLEGSTGETEAYSLEVKSEGARVIGTDEAGLAYGAQTLLQLIDLFRGRSTWAAVHIGDRPAYRKRCFMVDLGRSVYSMPLLKRIVRILARLKMNQLHLHLYDDQLCGLRFEGLPFGRENPYAISLADLSALVEYAARYHVEIVPELEGWGHVGSLVYHRPELRGGPGMYRGSSFLIGEETFALMSELIRQVASVMPRQATIHLGLDEARWYPHPDLADFGPERLVARYHEILRQTGQDLVLRIWADHGGRPVPDENRDEIIIEPWQYWIRNRHMIDRAIGRYSALGMRWMMGAGQSGMHMRGAYMATRYWCQQAVDAPGVEGVNITFWENNNLDYNLVSLFVGAYFAWNPRPWTRFAEIADYETFDRFVYPVMRRWQGTFRDASPEEIRADRGPEVFLGYYVWGEKHGQPVAPTATVDNADVVSKMFAKEE